MKAQIQITIALLVGAALFKLALDYFPPPMTCDEAIDRIHINHFCTTSISCGTDTTDAELQLEALSVIKRERCEGS